MIAFHGDPKIKAKYLKRVRMHAKADKIIKGQYWLRGKGCAVGCTIHGSDHHKYETELGIPEWLARVEDTLFEGMSNEKAKLWPERFLSAIKPGSDLEQTKIPFVIFILENSLQSLEQVKFDAEKFPDVQKVINQSKAAVKEMIRCHKNGNDLSAARSAASAAWSAASAAWSAANAAWSAANAANEKFADKLIELIEAL